MMKSKEKRLLELKLKPVITQEEKLEIQKIQQHNDRINNQQIHL